MLLAVLKKLKNKSQKLTFIYKRDDGKVVTFTVYRKSISEPFIIDETRCCKPYASYALADEFATFCFFTSRHDQLIKKHFHLTIKGTKANEY